MQIKQRTENKAESIIIYVITGILILVLNSVFDEGLTFISVVASIGSVISNRLSLKNLDFKNMCFKAISWNDVLKLVDERICNGLNQKIRFRQ